MPSTGPDRHANLARLCSEFASHAQTLQRDFHPAAPASKLSAQLSLPVSSFDSSPPRTSPSGTQRFSTIPMLSNPMQSIEPNSAMPSRMSSNNSLARRSLRLISTCSSANLSSPLIQLSAIERAARLKPSIWISESFPSRPPLMCTPTANEPGWLPAPDRTSRLSSPHSSATPPHSRLAHPLGGVSWPSAGRQRICYVAGTKGSSNEVGLDRSQTPS
jgi:hypothetical protein